MPRSPSAAYARPSPGASIKSPELNAPRTSQIQGMVNLNGDCSKAQNVVLVHGLFADGSCWTEVVARLQPKGISVTSVQNPLTTLPEAVAAAQRALAVQQGPTVLVGHSFSGMIVTEAGVDPKV